MKTLTEQLEDMKKYIQHLEQEIVTSLHRISNLTPEEEEPIIEEFVRLILSKQREAAEKAWDEKIAHRKLYNPEKVEEAKQQHLSQYDQK